MGLLEKHQELKRRVAEAREAALEARATRRSLEEREKDIVAELQALGTDPDHLEEAIKAEEAAIEKEMAAIEAALEHPQRPEPDKQLPPPEGNPAKTSASEVVAGLDVDDLLNMGTS